MISEIRSYLVSRITEENPDLKQWKDFFNIDAIPSTKIGDYYHISYALSGDIVTENQYTYSSVPVNLTLHKRQIGSDTVSAFDSLMDTAYNISLRAVSNTKRTDLIKRVVCTGITPEFLTGNDNTMRVTINFNFEILSKVIY